MSEQMPEPRNPYKVDGGEVKITEKQFSQQVVDLAQQLGWRVYRTWTSMHSPKGFPDLTMVRGERLIFAELKSEIGKPTEAQTEWLTALMTTGKVEVYLWRPSQINEIAEVLQRG